MGELQWCVLHNFAVYLWHSEGWTPKNEATMEAVVKQARTTSHSWLLACDAKMDRNEFRRGMWFKEEYKKIAALKVGVST